MSEEKKYWKWKSTIIDFDNITDEKADYGFEYMSKKDYVFHFLGCPDKGIHEWYNGGWSSEYNQAIKYAKELDLIEEYRDYDDELFEKQETINKQKEVLDKIKEKINKQLLSNTNLIKYTDEQCLKDILELLEEIE